ncbi:MAG TPA: response regulator transcription factor [Marmoricola sp.]|nr:response regulator transcription factor [Marmoricola sp.]
MARILVVDDDVTVREVVTSYLQAHHHTTLEAGDGEQAVRLVGQEPIDLVVLDLMLPGIDGLEATRRIRAQRDLPIIMLTALGSQQDRLLGLELGADDYLTKPFSPRELALRADSILRRMGAGTVSRGDILRNGDLELDPTRHRVTRDGDELTLTTREFALLQFLMTNPGVAFSREELLEQVWGWTIGDQTTVTVHVRRLREKIEVDPTTPTRLVTVWGVGYRWEAA